MRKKILIMLTLVNSLLLSTAWAAEEMWADDRTAQTAREQERIYGSQLMTEQERSEYREKIHAAPSEEERAKIRMEHHDLMQERAKARGITLPDAPEHGMEHDENRHGGAKMHN